MALPNEVQAAKTDMSRSEFVVELCLTVLVVGLFTTLAVWLGVFLGKKYNTSTVLGYASWVGMVSVYIMNFFKPTLKKPMIRHLDEAMFEVKE